MNPKKPSDHGTCGPQEKTEFPSCAPTGVSAGEAPGMNVILTLCVHSAKWTYALFLCVLALTALLLRPIDALTIRLAPSAATNAAPGRDAPLFMAVAPLGQEFSTVYLHSVQRTPVQDIYRIVDGRIWSWQERVQSHNAGLPFARPPFGRFRLDSPWMIFEGGRQSWESILLRVGNAELGQNLFSYGTEAPSVALYKRFPGERLQLGVERHPWMMLLPRISDARKVGGVYRGSDK